MKAKLIDLKKIYDMRGSMLVFENGHNLPFELKRSYFIYDIPSDSSRGSHAHINLNQIIIAASGSFEVEVDDGEHKKTFLLNNPSKALFLPKMHWRVILKFSTGSICLVYASAIYDESDYIRNYDEFKKRVLLSS